MVVHERRGSHGHLGCANADAVARDLAGFYAAVRDSSGFSAVARDLVGFYAAAIDPDYVVSQRVEHYRHEQRCDRVSDCSDLHSHRTAAVIGNAGEGIVSADEEIAVVTVSEASGAKAAR